MQGEKAMRVAIYARVSTDAQEARGTIGSQLAVLRERVAQEGHEPIAEYIDDGFSGARLDRPGLDALRDAAEAGYIEGVWCLSADRLARMYAYQVIVLDELARHGVSVSFHDTPMIEDDPQARLLTQVQGVIAEYERAKIAERYRRGKLWRARKGEVVAWKPPYGYRRISRVDDRPAHLEVFEPEAVIVRRIFDDYVHKDLSMRQITKGLNYDRIGSPSGKAVWGVSTFARILRNEAYIGRVYANRTEAVPDRCLAGKTRQMRRPRDQWVAIAVPAILNDELFEAAQHVSRDNSKWNARRAEPGHWLLRGLVKCGHCEVGVSCHKMRGRNGTFHRYYYCRNHDPLRAGGEHRRCPGRNIRADELDAFVFEQVRDTLLRPDVLLNGEQAVSARREPADDELLQAQLAKLKRKIDAVAGERRRLADLYQAAFIEREELLHRGNELQRRERDLQDQRDALIDQRKELAHQNTLRKRIAGFSARVGAAVDDLDFHQRQKLLRLVVEHVLVQGWRVEIQLRIPLDEPPPTPSGSGQSSKDRLRSLGNDCFRMVEQAVEDGGSQRCIVVEDCGPFSIDAIGRDDGRAALVSLADDLEQQVGTGFVDGEISELVEYQDAGFDIAVETLLESAGGLGGGQGVDHVDGAGEQHRVAFFAGAQAQGDGQVRLAKSDAAYQHDVAGLFDELQAEQVHHLLPIDLFGPGPVEPIEGLFDGEAGEADAPGDGAVAAPGGLALDETGEQGQVVPLLFGGGLDEVGVVFAHERQLDGVEVGVEGVEVDFGRSFHGVFSGSRWRS